jgi:tetratricopeptide (TPR) repeat protein
MLVISYAGILSGQTSADFVLRGKALIDSGKSDEAINTLTQAMQTFNESSLYLLRADAFMLKGDYSQAISDLNSANKLQPSSGEYGLARIYSLKGDAATAVYHLEANLKSSYKKSEKEIMLIHLWHRRKQSRMASVMEERVV